MNRTPKVVLFELFHDAVGYHYNGSRAGYKFKVKMGNGKYIVESKTYRRKCDCENIGKRFAKSFNCKFIG